MKRVRKSIPKTTQSSQITLKLAQNSVWAAKNSKPVRNRILPRPVASTLPARPWSKALFSIQSTTQQNVTVREAALMQFPLWAPASQNLNRNQCLAQCGKNLVFHLNSKSVHSAWILQVWAGLLPQHLTANQHVSATTACTAKGSDRRLPSLRERQPQMAPGLSKRNSIVPRR